MIRLFWGKVGQAAMQYLGWKNHVRTGQIQRLKAHIVILLYHVAGFLSARRAARTVVGKCFLLAVDLNSSIQS